MESLEVGKCLGCGKNITYSHNSSDLKWTCEECDLKAKNNIDNVKQELKENKKENYYKLIGKKLNSIGKEIRINNNKKVIYFFDSKRSEIFFFDK